MISPDARFTRAPAVVARRIAGELVLVPVVRELRTDGAGHPGVFVLNETAAALWDVLEVPVGVGTLADHLSAQYEVNELDARRDVERVLVDMQARGVVVAIAATPAIPNEAR